MHALKCTRTGQIHVNDLSDFAGTLAEDDDLVREKDSFRDVVSDEEHCLLRLQPNPLKFKIHLFPCKGVEGPERLIHQEERGIMNKSLSVNKY